MATDNEHVHFDKVNGSSKWFHSTGSTHAVDKTHGRVWRTLSMYYGFTCLGLMTSVLGPTLAEVGVLLKTDVGRLGTAFTANGVGYLTGSVVAGAFYDRLPPEPQLAAAMFLSAAATAVAPFVGRLAGFVAAMAVQGIGMAYIDAGTQAFCLLVWKGHRFQNAVLQGLFVFWSAGSTVGPLILQVFFLPPASKLREDSLQDKCSPNITSEDLTTQDASNIISVNRTGQFGIVSAPNTEADSLRVQYGYLLVGLLLLPGVLLYLVTYFRYCTPRKETTSITKATKPKKKKYLAKEVICLGLLFCFFALYVALEVTYGGFVSLFGTRGLCLENTRGAMMTSLFWGAFGLGRILGVPMSMRLPPMHMLVCNLSLVFTGLLLLVLSAHVHQVIPWVVSGLVGLGMSTVYPSAYLWASQRINITGFATGLFLLGGSLGAMVVPAVTGVLLQTQSPFFFGYVTLGVNIAVIVFLIIIFCYDRKYISRGDNGPRSATNDTDEDIAQKLKLMK